MLNNLRPPVQYILMIALFAGSVAGGLAVPEAAAQRSSTLGPQSVAPVARDLIPAVVNISTSQVSRSSRGVPLPEVPDGAPFKEFFDDFFHKDGEGSGVGRKVSSLGSGFVINGEEGLIVTNNHVITDADEIFVNFSDGSKLKVEKVLGRDAKTDLALLKVKPKSPLSEVKFGPSGTLEVGDWVMAIGNPFGLGGSVTVGIISAKERDINYCPYEDYLQRDAAINKCYSGGPLVNMKGEVIGVNTAIISPTGGSIGIGFAVPSDTAVNVIEQLRLYGETRRGWLGVRIQSVSDDLASSLGVDAEKGALVASVEEGSPAASSGLKNGDVILKFDGKNVMKMRGLPRIVAQTPIGKNVPVEVLRDGKRITLSVEVGRLKEPDGSKDEKETSEAEQAPKSEQKGPAIAGLSVSVVNDELRRKYKLGVKSNGLVVTAVDPSSPAAKKNLQEGDVIIEVAQARVETLEALLKAVESVKKSGRKAVLLRIQTPRGDMRYVAVPVN